MSDLFFIYASDCDECNQVRQIILDELQVIPDSINLVEIDSEDDRAIDVAVEHGILDIPGVAGGGISCYGDNINRQDIHRIIEKISKNV